MMRTLVAAALAASAFVAIAAETESKTESAPAAQSGEPFVGGNADAAASKATTCFACHGPGGNSANPEWPKLAGQHAGYLYAQLKHFKDGSRPMPIMMGQAATMDDKAMKDFAAFFAAQKMQPGVASPDSIAVAQKLYRAGDAARGLPACAACHGPQGRGNAGAGYPRIGGQHAKYVAIRLDEYRNGKAGPNGGNTAMMAAVAAKLTDAEVQALASYVNGLQ